MFQRGYLSEFLVTLFQQSLIGIVQPVSFTVHYRMESLCIELSVIDGNVCVDGCRYLHADEASVARKVGEQVFVVACGNERGISSHFLNACAVWLAEAGRRFLQQVLQESLLVHTYLVEFIQIYKEEATQVAARFSAAWYVTVSVW